MQLIGTWAYDTIEKVVEKSSHIRIFDHMGGFDCNLNNDILHQINTFAKTNEQIITVYTEYIFDENVRKCYQYLDLKFDFDAHKTVLDLIKDYRQPPAQSFKNFLCSFNGSPHVSRKLLVSILNKLGLFDDKYSTKNFIINPVELEGHLFDYVSGNLERFYNKFFINANSFNYAIHTDNYSPQDHYNNICTLDSRIADSFLHVVSETMATSYYPFYGEKFLFSIVCRGLFVAYAHPNWHTHLEKHYGFRLYNNIFDYKFDRIQNPIERLVEMIAMIFKFSALSTHDWHDLYLMELENIEFNYEHYFSQNYLKCLAKHI